MPDEQVLLTQHQLPLYAWERAEKALRAINNRIARYRHPVPPLTWRVGRPYLAEKEQNLIVEGAYGGSEAVTRTVTLECVDVEVWGVEPRFEGWRVWTVGRPACEEVDAEEVRGTILYTTLPNLPELPATYRGRTTLHCDHCHTDRDRRTVFVLLHDDGRERQVGGSCLKDYTGGWDPHGMMAYAELLPTLDLRFEEAEFGEDGEGRRRAVRALDLVRLLAHAADSIRQYGYVKADPDGYDASTKDCALTAYYDNHKIASPEAVTEAEELLAFAQDRLLPLDPETLSEYEYKLRLICQSEMIAERMAGLAVSLFPWAGRIKERAKQAELLTGSGFVGEPKTRLRNVPVTVVSTRTIPCHSGYAESKTIVTFAHEGRALVWFTTTEPDCEPGQTYLLTGTVKEHNTYRPRNGGTPIDQTILQRVSLDPSLRMAA